LIFAKLDVSVYSHRRFAAAGFEAVGYWTMILAYLRHQESEDGFLSSDLLGVPLGAGRERCLPLCEKLVSVGLFRKVDDGYFLVHYAEKNETRDVIELRVKATRARKASYRKSLSRVPETTLSRVPEGGDVPRPRRVRCPASPTLMQGRGTSDSDSDSSSLSDSGSGSDSDSDSASPAGGPGGERVASAPESVSHGGPPEGVSPSPGDRDRARRPLPPSERFVSGNYWLAAFTEGISEVTGRPCTAGRMYLGTLERIIAHHAPERAAPQACAWLKEQAASFARKWDGKHPPKGLTPDGLERWLNEGRQGPPEFGSKRIVQLPADKWTGDDLSDLGAEVIR
jgi:hypothetical protein